MWATILGEGKGTGMAPRPTITLTLSLSLSNGPQPARPISSQRPPDPGASCASPPTSAPACIHPTRLLSPLQLLPALPHRYRATCTHPCLALPCPASCQCAWLARAIHPPVAGPPQLEPRLIRLLLSATAALSAGTSTTSFSSWPLTTCLYTVVYPPIWVTSGCNSVGSEPDAPTDGHWQLQQLRATIGYWIKGLLASLASA